MGWQGLTCIFPCPSEKCTRRLSGLGSPALSTERAALAKCDWSNSPEKMRNCFALKGLLGFAPRRSLRAGGPSSGWKYPG